MHARIPALGLSLLLAQLAPLTALAAEGLTAPTAEAVWPSWQARITLLTASPLVVSLTPRGDGGLAAGGVQGGALLGDYYFARQWFGSFRASGGLMNGRQAGMPLAMAGPGARLGLNVNGSAAWNPPGSSDSPGTVSYFGLGYNGQLWHSSLAISADIGMVAANIGASWGAGRAIFGSQSLDGALHDVRLTPLVQLGVRYRF